MFIKQFDAVQKQLPKSINLTICDDTGDRIHYLVNLQTAGLNIPTKRFLSMMFFKDLLSFLII